MRSLIFFALVFVIGCGSSKKAGFDGATDDAGDQTGNGPCDIDPLSADCINGDGGEAGPSCDGLECQIVNCGTSDGTTISGTVYDPGAQRGLYNVFVYVPNRPLDPIATGPVCTACQAPASGKPIASAATDAKGKFVIKNAPAGTNIPLVMQLGKWRRRVTIPNVTQCVDNAQSNKDVMRLPKKQNEGNTDSNIPQIAFTTGCDWAECFLNRTVGIDPSEFTGPSAKGRVHIYKSMYDDGQQAAVSPGDAYQFWANLVQMKKYDIIFDACECSPYPRDTQGPAYTNMKTYLESGGRMFGTHFHYNWFAPSTGPADFQMQAPWLQAGGFGAPPFLIDTSFPRGKAFADWAQNFMVTTMYGQINVTDTRNSVAGLNGGMAGNGMYKNSTQWIYHTQNQTLYLSFNTPTNKMPKDQCGRAVFSDVHLSGDGYPVQGQFPSYCMQALGHDKNEQALEFLFFDLSSCVQDDKSQPIQPPPN